MKLHSDPDGFIALLDLVSELKLTLRFREPKKKVSNYKAWGF